jgi:flagellar motor protein MotB
VLSLPNGGGVVPYKWKIIIAWLAGLIAVYWILVRACSNGNTLTQTPAPAVAKSTASNAVPQTPRSAEAPGDHPAATKASVDEPQSDQEIIQSWSDQLQHEAQTDWPKLKAELWAYFLDPMFQKQQMLIKDLSDDADHIRQVESQLFKDAALRVDKQSAFSHSLILSDANVTVSAVIETIHGPGQIHGFTILPLEADTVNGFRRTDVKLLNELQPIATAYEQESHETQSRFPAASECMLLLKKAHWLVQSANDRFDHDDLLGAYIAANHAELLLHYLMDEIDPFRVSVYNKTQSRVKY